MTRIIAVMFFILAAGCTASPTIIGYGEGKSPAEASLAAWHNANEKLQVSGMKGRVLIEDELLTSQGLQSSSGELSYARTSIRFRVVKE
jgi:hypothetical protein